MPSNAALVVPRQDVVALDADSCVRSHFERLFFDTYSLILSQFLHPGHLALPEEPEAFRTQFEQQWRRVLRYGNGNFGLTVQPLVSILDMVRYQQLKGGDDLVSWSVANWVRWKMDVFPLTVQRVVPDFREVALKRRLVAMFEPLVGYCALLAARRLRLADETEGQSDYSRLQEEFRAVLSAAIEKYDFMYGKDGTPEQAVGALGLSESPKRRARADAALQALDIPLGSKDLAHVGIAAFLSARLRQHLREFYPARRTGVLSTDASYGEGAESLAETLREDDAKGLIEGHAGVADGQAWIVDGSPITALSAWPSHAESPLTSWGIGIR